MDMNTCPVCRLPARLQWATDAGRKPWYMAFCDKCGRYVITLEASEDIDGWEHNDPLIRKRLQRFLYEQEGEGNVLISSGVLNLDEAEQKQRIAIDLRSATQLYRDEGSPLSKYHGTLRRIAAKTESFGHIFNSIDDRWLVPTMDDNEARLIINALAKERYIETHHGKPSDDADWYSSLTPEGLKYADELRHVVKIEGRVVFVAACLSEDLRPARDAIQQVLDDLGYSPILVDILPHNDLIDLKIYEGIRESKFIVADLTCNRQSVYYEVGFAHGLGLDVVLTCRHDCLADADDDFKRVHFDLNHRKILIWNSETELAQILRAHIHQLYGRAELQK